MITSPLPSKKRLAHLKPGKQAFQLANHATRMLNEPLLGQPTHDSLSFTPNLVAFYPHGLETPDPDYANTVIAGLRSYKETTSLVSGFENLIQILNPDWLSQEIDLGYEEVREVWIGAGQQKAVDRVLPYRVNVLIEPQPIYQNQHWHAYWTLGLEMRLVVATIMQRENDSGLCLYTFPELIRLCWANLFANHSSRMALEPRFEIYNWRDIRERYGGSDECR